MRGEKIMNSAKAMKIALISGISGVSLLLGSAFANSQKQVAQNILTSSRAEEAQKTVEALASARQELANKLSQKIEADISARIDEQAANYVNRFACKQSNSYIADMFSKCRYRGNGVPTKSDPKDQFLDYFKSTTAQQRFDFVKGWCKRDFYSNTTINDPDAWRDSFEHYPALDIKFGVGVERKIFPSTIEGNFASDPANWMAAVTTVTAQNVGACSVTSLL
jgi:hypothetical protein